MIDTKALRQVAVDCSWPTSPVPIGDIIDRLEAVEKERDDVAQQLVQSEQGKREACAQIVERNAAVCRPHSELHDILRANAAAIRARGDA